jgi:hypothetical protein
MLCTAFSLPSLGRHETRQRREWLGSIRHAVLLALEMVVWGTVSHIRIFILPRHAVPQYAAVSHIIVWSWR